MKKIAGILVLALLGLGQAAEAGYMVTVYGPKMYGRTTGQPNIYQDTFTGLPGKLARLQITNGNLNGTGRVTSARVLVNGKQVLGPNDFKKKSYSLQLPVPLGEQNTLQVELRSAPQSFLSVRVTQDIAFEEGDENLVKADLAVTALTLTPDRANPGDPVAVRGTVTNLSPRQAPGAILVFRVDDVEIRRLPVNALTGGSSRDFTANFAAARPGRQQVTAALELPETVTDPNTGNNLRQATLRVSGETPPKPELEFSQVNFTPDPLTPGQPASITLNVRNPGFVGLENVGVTLYIDGTPVLPPIIEAVQAAVPLLTGGDEAPWLPGGGDEAGWASVIIDYLAPGQSKLLTLPWDNVTPGQHVLKVQLSHVPDLFPLEQRLTAWNVIIPAPTVLNQADTWPPWLFPWMDKWFSIGPYHMTHPEFEGYHDSSDPWGGRMTCLAFHPILNNPPLVYAGCINGGGIWQSQGSGDSWAPIGDQLSSMKISALAVDPEHPQIIYAAAGYWKATDPFPLSFKETTGPIFKSVNGEWKLFAAPAQGYSKLEVRQLPSGHTVIYAASNRGLLRYKTINWWETSAGGTWENIMPGAKIADMVVHPTNPDIVYAVPYVTVYKSGVAFEVPDGIWRTSSGTTMTPSPLWGIGWKFRSPISNDMTALVNRTGSQLHLDLFRANPNKVYASLLKPPTDSCKSCGHVELFYSNNEGQSWTFSISNTYYQGGDPNLAATFSWTDNSFLRSHPTREDWLYYGYVYLWRTYKDGTGQWQNQLVSDIHPDVHDLKFHPKDEYFYLAGDGGVYRGAVGELTSEEGWTYVYEVFQGLNNDLRNAQVYDFDVSQTNPDVMLAGTQDEGTIEYTAPTYPGQTPSWKWRCIRGGDGMYSLIAPSDNSIFYSQYVSGIDSTKISQGGWGGWGSRPHNNLVKTDSNGSLTWGNQYITVDPFDPYHVLAQGPQVQETTDDMYHWTQAGPPAIGLAPDWTQVVRQGNIRRVIFNPTIPGTWFAGTDKGGQIWEKVPNFFLGDWRCVFQHPEPNARVVSMAFAPNNPDILYVAFDNVDIFKGFFRLLRLQRGVEGNWKPYWIAWDLPREHLPLKKDLEVKCLVGDPQDDRVAYLATDKGIFKGKTSNADSPAMWTWKPYNEGLPLVEVTKLIPLKNEPQMRASTYGRGLWAVWLRPPAMND